MAAPCASFDVKDSENDIIKKGAFQKSIIEQGPKSSTPRIRHLMNHDPFKPLGVILELKEDNTGLYYESKIGSHSLGIDYVKMVDSGLITEHSIGFSTIKKTVQNPNADYRDQTTQLNELKLWEFSSLTAWGANQYTPLLGMKSKQGVEDRLAKLIKAIETGTFTDSTFAFLNDELLFLQKAFKDISTKPEPPATTLPDTWKNWCNKITIK